MATGGFRFDRFRLDAADRLLTLDGAPVELNARYLDALALLVAESGRLVTKDRFLEEVWRGVPVTDEALTQCIRTLRRQLGDDAARPRFIETVPKHGYRFIAPVEADEAAPKTRESIPGRWSRFWLLGAAGTAGGAFAGGVGGLLYGFAGAPQALEPGMGAASVLLVLVALTVVVGVLGGAGVAFGIAAAGLAPGRPGLKSVLGGAGGGLLVGGMVKLLGLDAFNLLFGRTPGEITGALEGALLGGAVGFAALWAARLAARRSLALAVAAAGLVGGVAGLVIPLLGGRLMGGSLDLLARGFPGSRLRLDRIGALFGEPGFGPLAQAATGAVEGLLFSACLVAAMLIARRTWLDPQT
ncbi:transcriptional regulator [Caulobacter sp. SLTY]|uniref:winged helix-turn-helix domain-containing protein n=1 Tax=Caulobacter sp. SLTY TaxID=2683262 RepID=UPI001411E990|nr:winged helix-turn-helix domain-containing protein [Caulobacter sp. SLTY]NBB15380.1 transcriptional regulator [Caulobacter sp. SLTY]